MFVAVVDLLRRASSDVPVVVVLDDLHWADPGTVQLLRWVLTETNDNQLLLIGTFRDSDIDADHPLSGLLAELHRRPGIDRIQLTGFGDAEVLALLEALAGHEMTGDGLDLRDELLAETGANPFYLGEMVRHLSESGAIRQGADGPMDRRRLLLQGMHRKMTGVTWDDEPRWHSRASGSNRCSCQ